MLLPVWTWNDLYPAIYMQWHMVSFTTASFVEPLRLVALNDKPWVLRTYSIPILSGIFLWVVSINIRHRGSMIAVCIFLVFMGQPYKWNKNSTDS